MDEKRILEAVANGDIQAFGSLFFRYQPRLQFFLNGLLHDADLAKDMTQDIFMYLWEHRSKLSQVNHFSSYLFQMAKYMVFNHYDHLEVEDRYLMKYLENASEAIYSDEEKLFAKDLNNHIDHILSTVSVQRRKVYAMSRKMGLSNSEIAERLNISKRTVENHISAVLSLLRKYLFLFLIVCLQLLNLLVR